MNPLTPLLFQLLAGLLLVLLLLGGVCLLLALWYRLDQARAMRAAAGAGAPEERPVVVDLFPWR